MSAKKKCCCNVTVGPCACSPGAPWVAGLGTSVRLRTQFSGIVNTGPSLPWGCIKRGNEWWGGGADTDPIVPGACGTSTNFEAYAAFETAKYNEGNTWRILGGGSQNGESDPYPRNQAACSFAYSYQFNNGPFTYPDFGTIVGTFSFRSTVTTSIVYDASANETTFSVYARTVNLSSLITWTPYVRVTTDPGYCNNVVDTGASPLTRDLYTSGTGNTLPVFLVWFSNTTVISGKPCPQKTYTLTNTAPAQVPYIVDAYGLGFGGSIRICSSGTCALSLR